MAKHKTTETHKPAAAKPAAEKPPASTTPEKTADQHRDELNAAGQDHKPDVVHSQQHGQAFVAVHPNGVHNPTVEAAKAAEAANTKQHFEPGSVSGVGTDPTGVAAGPPAEPIKDFGAAAPGNARAGATGLGGS